MNWTIPISYLVILSFITQISHAGYEGLTCRKVFESQIQSQIQSQLEDPLSVEIERKRVRHLKEKITKREERPEIAEEINKMLTLVLYEGKKGDRVEAKTTRIYAYAREQLVNRLLGWVSAKGGHDVPFYFVKDGTYQRIEILTGLLRGTIRLPSPSEMNYEENIRGYRQAFEHIGRWVREYRSYHELIKLQFLKYIRAQLEYKALAEAITKSKNSNETIYLKVPVEVEANGQVEYNDQFFLGVSEVRQQMIKLEMSYPGIKKMSLSEFWQKSRFDASAVEFTGSIGQLRYRHAELQEKIHSVLRRLLSTSLRMDIDFNKFSAILRDCKVSEFYIQEIEQLFKWVQNNDFKVPAPDIANDSRPTRFVIAQGLDADLPSEIAFNREVFNAQLKFMFGAKTEFSDDVRLLNRLLPIEKKEKIDLKGGWIRQKITRIKNLLVYSAVIGTLTSAAYSLYGVEISKYFEDLQITANILTSNIEKKIAEVESSEQFFKNLANYIENRYPNEQADKIQLLIASIHQALTHEKEPDRAISDLGQIENESLARELQHLLALHYQYKAKLERNGLLATMSQNLLVPQEKPAGIEAEIFNIAKIMDPAEYQRKAIDLIKFKLVKNLTSTQEKELYEYLQRGTKLNENFWNHLEYQENPILMIVKTYSEKYNITVDQRTIFLSYVNRIMSTHEHVQFLYKGRSNPSIELEIVDLKFQKVKEIFEFFDGINTTQPLKSKFPN